MGSIFQTTRRNQDLDMELKVKLQKPINKKQEEKRQWTMKNAGNSDDKLYTINFFSQLAKWEIIKDRAGGRPPLPPVLTYSILKIY